MGESDAKWRRDRGGEILFVTSCVGIFAVIVAGVTYFVVKLLA